MSEVDRLTKLNAELEKHLRASLSTQQALITMLARTLNTDQRGKQSKGLKCSFCGKSQKQTRKLIAGPGVYICDECVELCQEILDEELATSASTQAAPKQTDLQGTEDDVDSEPPPGNYTHRATTTDEQMVRRKCSFCGQSEPIVRKLMAGPGVNICDECVDLCQEILDEEFPNNPRAQRARKRQRPVQHCGFCGKAKDEVPCLIAGPGVFICSDCVQLCNEIIRDRGGNDSELIIP